MSTLTDRIARLEAQSRASVSNEKMLAAAVSDISARLASSKAEQNQERLDPGSLHQFSGPLRGHRQGQVPDIGAPLMDRLRDDANTIEGRSVPFEGTGNVLVDPVFETNYFTATLPGGGFTVIHTAYSSLGPNWEAKYTASGTSPIVEATAFPGGRIGIPDTRGSSSAPVSLDGSWGGVVAVGSTATIYLRPVTAFTPAVDTIAYPYLVASCRIGATIADDVSFDPPTSATAWLEIVDGSDTVLSTGDEVDLVQLAAMDWATQLEVTLPEAPDVTGATSYRMRVAVQIVPNNTVSTDVSAQVYEPQMSFSDEDTPQSFQPAVGAWTPYFLRSVNITGEMTWSVGYQGVGADKNDYTYSGWQSSIVHFLDGGASNRNFTGFAAPTSLVEGTVKVICNAGATNNHVLKHDSASSVASNRIYGVNNADVTIRPRGGVILIWSSDAGDATTHLRWRVLNLI